MAELDAGNTNAVLPFALDFTSFRIFCGCGGCRLAATCRARPNGKIKKLRKKVIGGSAIVGAFAGALSILSCSYIPNGCRLRCENTPSSTIFPTLSKTPPHPITPVTLYGLIILVPLLFSSHRQIRSSAGWLRCPWRWHRRPIMLLLSLSGASSLPCSRSISST